jgi:protein associated with RNAse G/E
VDKVKIISTKHNGSIHRSWDSAWVRSVQQPVLFIPANTQVNNPDGSVWSSSYDVEAHFYHESWFNVFTLLKKEGVEWYCNIAGPPTWNKASGELWFVDYDLDVYVYADGSYKVLDREEYVQHARMMQYPDTVKSRIEAGLEELIRLIQTRSGTFAKHE